MRLDVLPATAGRVTIGIVGGEVGSEERLGDFFPTVEKDFAVALVRNAGGGKRAIGMKTKVPVLSNEDQIVAAIRQIIRAVDLHSRHLVNGHGMTGPQLAVLQEAKRLGPVSPTALSRAVHLSQATVTGILQRLERRGLIQREQSVSDRRSVFVQITSAGLEFLSGSPSLLQDRFRDALSALEDWERLQILSTLQRVASLMDADEIDAAPHLTSGDIPTPTDDLSGSGESS